MDAILSLDNEGPESGEHDSNSPAPYKEVNGSQIREPNRTETEPRKKPKLISN